jgi:hypothetical protein
MYWFYSDDGGASLRGLHGTGEEKALTVNGDLIIRHFSDTTGGMDPMRINVVHAIAENMHKMREKSCQSGIQSRTPRRGDCNSFALITRGVRMGIPVFVFRRRII